MDPDKTIRTTTAGRRAAAARDRRLEAGEAPTRPLMLSSEPRARHTSGPWWLAEDMSKPLRPVYLVCSSRDPIGRVSNGTGTTPDEARANAHLIAAAPQLLEALRELVAMIERAAAAGVDTTGHVGVGDALHAIRKATGAA